MPPTQTSACSPRKALKFRPRIRFSKIHPIRHPGVQSYPLRCARIHPGPSSTLFVHLTYPGSAALPNCLNNPLPCALAFTSHSRRCPGLKLLPRCRTPPLPTRPSLPAYRAQVRRRFEVLVAWNIDEDVRRLLVPPSPAFRLRVLVEMKTRICVAFSFSKH